MKKYMTWEQFEETGKKLVSVLRDSQIDLIVGASRGGLPLAVFLSHNLQCRNFGTIHVKKTSSDEAFALERSTNLDVLGAVLPDVRPHTVLLVDDIVTYGDLLTEMDKLVRKQYGEEIHILYATLFSDSNQIQPGPYAGILKDLYTGEDIDNRDVWVVFPWEREEDQN